MIITPTISSVTATESGMVSLTPGRPVEVDDEVAARLIDAGLAAAADAEPKKQTGRKRVPAAPENKGS